MGLGTRLLNISHLQVAGRDPHRCRLAFESITFNLRSFNSGLIDLDFLARPAAI